MLTKLIWGMKEKMMHFKKLYIFWRVHSNAYFKIGCGLTEKTENRICPQMTSVKGQLTGTIHSLLHLVNGPIANALHGYFLRKKAFVS